MTEQDIVVRLRDSWAGKPSLFRDMHEAADEIERLRARIDELLGKGRDV